MTDVKKKETKDWFIAMTYFLTAGFVIPVLVTMVFALVTIPFTGMDTQGNPINPLLPIPLAIAYDVVGVFGIWLGVVYASKYVRKTYVISHSMHIVNLATIYFVVIAVAFSVITAGSMQTVPSVLFEINLAGWLIDIVVFYFASKKELLGQ